MYASEHLPAIKFNGVYRVLACVFSTEESTKDFPLFSSRMGLAPSEWREIDLSWYKNQIWDQQATSSCVGQGATAGMQLCWMQSGRSRQEFNPYFVYGFINNGRDAGAMISDALKSLMSNGTCLKNDLKPGMMFKHQFPQSAIQNAKRFRLMQAFKCNTFEDICSAITLGFVCPLGILVDHNFPNVDSQGVSPIPRGRGAGGHCILGVGLKKSHRYGWMIKTQNSWGGRFGINGHSYIHKGHFQFMHPDAFAIQSIMDDPADNTPADEVPVVVVNP